MLTKANGKFSESILPSCYVSYTQIVSYIYVILNLFFQGVIITCYTIIVLRTTIATRLIAP